MLKMRSREVPPTSCNFKSMQNPCVLVDFHDFPPKSVRVVRNPWILRDFHEFWWNRLKFTIFDGLRGKSDQNEENPRVLMNFQEFPPGSPNSMQIPVFDRISSDLRGTSWHPSKSTVSCPFENSPRNEARMHLR